jgi:hypothetical protein
MGGESRGGEVPDDIAQQGQTEQQPLLQLKQPQMYNVGGIPGFHVLKNCFTEEFEKFLVMTLHPSEPLVGEAGAPVPGLAGPGFGFPWRKLSRLVRYLRATQELGICLSGDLLSVACYTDASHAVDDGMKGRTGSFISIGDGPVFARSVVQSIVTLSSAESEVVALADSLPQVLWTRYYLESHGFDVPSLTVSARARSSSSTSTRTLKSQISSPSPFKGSISDVYGSSYSTGSCIVGRRPLLLLAVGSGSAPYGHH